MSRADIYAKAFELEAQLKETTAALTAATQRADDAEMRERMLKTVHGALLDAGCSLGEIGTCEADAVRSLADRLAASEQAREAADNHAVEASARAVKSGLDLYDMRIRAEAAEQRVKELEATLSEYGSIFAQIMATAITGYADAAIVGMGPFDHRHAIRSVQTCADTAKRLRGELATAESQLAVMRAALAGLYAFASEDFPPDASDALLSTYHAPEYRDAFLAARAALSQPNSGEAVARVLQVAAELAPGTPYALGATGNGQLERFHEAWLALPACYREGKEKA